MQKMCSKALKECYIFSSL